jgi:hypothetical protein
MICVAHIFLLPPVSSFMRIGVITLCMYSQSISELSSARCSWTYSFIFMHNFWFLSSNRGKSCFDFVFITNFLFIQNFWYQFLTTCAFQDVATPIFEAMQTATSQHLFQFFHTGILSTATDSARESIWHRSLTEMIWWVARLSTLPSMTTSTKGRQVPRLVLGGTLVGGVSCNAAT